MADLVLLSLLAAGFSRGPRHACHTFSALFLNGNVTSLILSSPAIFSTIATAPASLFLIVTHVYPGSYGATFA